MKMIRVAGANKPMLKVSRAEWSSIGCKAGWLKLSSSDILGIIKAEVIRRETEVSSMIRLMQTDPSVVTKEPQVTAEQIRSKVHLPGYDTEFILVRQSDTTIIDKTSAEDAVARAFAVLCNMHRNDPNVYPILAHIKAGRNFSLSANFVKEGDPYLMPYFNGQAMQAVKSEFSALVRNTAGHIPGDSYLIQEQKIPGHHGSGQPTSRLKATIHNDVDATMAANAAGFLAAKGEIEVYPERLEGVTVGEHDYRGWTARLVFRGAQGIPTAARMAMVRYFTDIENMTLKEKDFKTQNIILAWRSEIGRLCYELGLQNQFMEAGIWAQQYHDSQAAKSSQNRDPVYGKKVIRLADYAEDIRKTVTMKHELVSRVVQHWGATRGDAEIVLQTAFDEGMAGHIMSSEAAAPAPETPAVPPA